MLIRLHILSTHRGINNLYLLVKKQVIWWYGIFTDTRNFIKNCWICNALHRQKMRKPLNTQIISNGQRERYIIDIQNIKNELQDTSAEYNYILAVIDHFSKLCGCFLLKRKTGNSIVIALNKFISIYGSPLIIQCDNCREFVNKEFKKYCIDNNIKIIHSSPRHPNTNGAVERLYQKINKSLLAQKIAYKNKYNIEIAISNAVHAQNNTVHSVTKYIPLQAFFNSNIENKTEIKNNIIKSQKNIDKNKNFILPNSYILLSSKFTLKGNTITPAIGKKGYFFIPGIISGIGKGNYYPYKLSVDYKNIKKNVDYFIDYKIIREIDDKIYNEFIRYHNENLKEKNDKDIIELLNDKNYNINDYIPDIYSKDM